MTSGPITSWKIDGETEGTVADFIFWGSKITADSDCGHEIKRHLLFGRKLMTTVDSMSIKLPVHFAQNSNKKFHNLYGNTIDPE